MRPPPLSSTQPDVTADLTRAMGLLSANRPLEAEALLDGLVPHLPGHPQLHYLRAEAALAKGDVAAALVHAVTSLGWERKRPEPFVLAGRLLHQAGNSPLGARLLERALTIDPAHAQAQAWLDALRAAPRADACHPAYEVLGRPVRISLCMIARDEARFLGRCLRAARRHVDEIVVVDTGSSDATAAIAAAHGARVERFTWRDDFAAARNAALEHATGDWALVLDADEVFEAPAGRLRALLDVLPIPALTGTAARVSPVLHNHVRLIVDAEAWEDQPVPRLFPREAFAFTGPIHEHPVPRPETGWALLDMLAAELEVHHFGYAPETLRARDKLARNITLLRVRHAEAPLDQNAAYFLARELTLDEQHDAAVVAFDRYWSIVSAAGPASIVRRAYSLHAGALVALGRSDEALDVLARGLQLDPDFPSTWFQQAETYVALGRYQDAISGYERAIARADYHERHPMGAHNALVPEHSGMVARRRLARAQALARGETPADPEARYTPVQRLLAAAREAIGQGDLAAAAAHLAEAEVADATHAQIPYLRAELAFRGSDLRAALEYALDAAERVPQQAEPWALAGWLLHESGDSELAQTCLARALACRPDYANAGKLLQQVAAGPRGERRHTALAARIATIPAPVGNAQLS